jgi:purine-binding chemotaxis protein CheW
MPDSSTITPNIPKQDLPANAALNVCIFRAGQRLYCLPAASVEYVYPYCEITPVPHEAESIEGVINLRGSIIPVIDMGMKCEKRPLERDPAHRLLVARVGSHRIALHVEEVMDVIDVEPSGWEETDAILPGIQMLTGIIKYQDGLALLYDPAAFFATELLSHNKPS